MYAGHGDGPEDSAVVGEVDGGIADVARVLTAVDEAEVNRDGSGGLVEVDAEYFV